MARKSNFPTNVDEMPVDELRAEYRRLLSSREGLKANNDSLTKWLTQVTKAVTILSCDGSLAFQAMAEKAGVRSHPSVTDVVRLFDAISHPQWESREPIPKIEWPDDWDFDRTDEWSGDADMSLNSPIAEAIEFIEAIRFRLPANSSERAAEVIDLLHKATLSKVAQVKEAAGFKPKKVAPPYPSHYRDMTKEQLVDLAGAVSWAILDMAQDMHFANNMLRRDLRAAVYRRVCGDLYALSHMSLEPRDEFLDIKVLGGDIPL